MKKPQSEGFRRVRVHDLKHTFGRRLRAAGVSFEDRQDLLGQERSHHDSLLASGAREFDSGCGSTVHNRVPQKSRNHPASLQDRLVCERFK